MPINPNIALGVRPMEQPNMLAQMGQMMGIRQAQQSYEEQNALRDAFAQGADIRDPEAFKRIASINPKLAYDLRGRHIEQQQKGVEIGLKTNEALGAALGGLVQNPTLDYARNTFSHLVSLGVLPEDKAAAMYAKLEAEPNRIKEYATLGVQAAISATSKMSDATTQRGQNLSHSASMAGVGVQRDRLNYDISNPTQHFFTSDDNTLMRAPTRGAGAAAPVPMAGTGARPPQVTFGGRGDGTTVGAGSSIMVNPASVNGLAPPVQNGLITQPQPTLAPSAPGFAKVRQPPNAVTNVNTFIPASETAQTEFMKGSRATYDQLKTASTVLDNIEKAKALVPTAKGFMGTGGETMLEIAKFMNNRIGTNIDTAGIKSAEELNTRAFMGILDNLKKLDAQPSQQQQAALKQALGSLNTDPNAMNAVLDVFGDIVRAKVDIYNQEVTGAEQRGIKFPYNPVIKLPERSTGATGATGAAGAAPLYATNGKERIVSTDGGKTWKPAGAK